MLIAKPKKRFPIPATMFFRQVLTYNKKHQSACELQFVCNNVSELIAIQNYLYSVSKVEGWGAAHGRIVYNGEENIHEMFHKATFPMILYIGASRPCGFTYSMLRSKVDEMIMTTVELDDTVYVPSESDIKLKITFSDWFSIEEVPDEFSQQSKNTWRCENVNC